MHYVVEDWRDAWLAEGGSPGTIRMYVSVLGEFSEWLAKPLESAIPTDLRQFIRLGRETYEAVIGGRTVTRGGESVPFLRWKALRSFYEFAAENEKWENPMPLVAKPKQADPIVKGVAADDLSKLLEACSGGSFYDVRDTAIIHVLRHGLRRTELANLRLGDWLPDEGCVVITARLKGGSVRTVPLNAEAVKALRHYLRLRKRHPMAKVEGPEWLWLGDKGGLMSNSILLMLRRRGRQAGGVKVTPHMFRRQFAVDWFSDGGSETTLMRLAGWNTAQMPSVYTRFAAHETSMAEFHAIEERRAGKAKSSGSDPSKRR